MKKALCTLLALIMICSCFLFACTKDPASTQGGSQNNNQNQQTTEEDLSSVYTAEIKNLGGKEFHFIARSVTAKHLDTHEIFSEGATGDKINDAVFKRNSQLEADFNCKITMTGAAKPQTDYRESLISGEYVADFLFMDFSKMRTLGQNNLLVDFNTLQSVDLSKTWWSQLALKALSINDKAFYVTGDGATLDDRATWVMYFNKEIVENNNLESPYDLVKQGKWTNAKFYEYIEACKFDMTGDGLFEANKDIIGYMGEQYNNWAHVVSSGARLSEVDDAGTLSIPLQPNRTLLDVLAELKPILTCPHRYIADSGSIFKKNLIAFYGVNIAGVLNFQDSEMALGFLPFPKRNEEQPTYLSSVDPTQYGVFSIPTTVENDPNEVWKTNGFTSAAEQCAYFLDAFSYYSVDTLTTAFYDQVLMKQSVRDSESIEMLEIALDKELAVIDPVFACNMGKMGSGLFYPLAGAYKTHANDAAYDTFVSEYMARVDAGRQALQDYITITDATL